MSTVEVHAYGKLYFLFKERDWSNPLQYDMEKPLTADQLRKELSIAAEDVEVVFINRKLKPLTTTLEEGDRVAFIPPGVPTIHRFHLGFYDLKK